MTDASRVVLLEELTYAWLFLLLVILFVKFGKGLLWLGLVRLGALPTEARFAQVLSDRLLVANFRKTITIPLVTHSFQMFGGTNLRHRMLRHRLPLPKSCLISFLLVLQVHVDLLDLRVVHLHVCECFHD